MPCNDPDHMECPCLCDCGKWFEVTDGWLPPGKSSGETVCRDCYEELLEEFGEEHAEDAEDVEIYE